MDVMWRFESLNMLLSQQGRYSILNTHAFCVYGTAGLKMNTRFMSNGKKEMSLQLEKRTCVMKVYVRQSNITAASH